MFLYIEAVPKIWRKSSEEKWPLKLVKNVGETKKLLLFKKGIGQFENKMFQYAATLGIAKENNREVVFHKNMLELKEVFQK